MTQTNALGKLQLLQLRRLKSRIDSITYKAPQFGAESGEVISGNLGRGEGGRFANIEDIKRASMSNNPLEVFGGSSKRMFQTFYNAFTRESPFATDLAASQKKVADLLAASGGNWTDEVKAAQAATDELWRLDTSYRRNMMTGDTGLKPGGIQMKIEGLNSDKAGTGQSVAEIMTAAGKDPAGMAQGIGERVVQDVYNYMSMFNQRDALKKLNNASPEINLTTLPEGQKYRIDEKALAEGKMKIDFAYDPNKPDGPSKDDITTAMSDIMMKLDPNIMQYASSFAQQNPNFQIGTGGLDGLLQQAMAAMTDDPQKMATENPDLFKFALSAAQGVNLFEGSQNGQAAETPTPAPKPVDEEKPVKPDSSKYPGNDVEAGLEQEYVMPTFESTPKRDVLRNEPDPKIGVPNRTSTVPDYINVPKGPVGNQTQPQEEVSSWDRAFPRDTVFPGELVGKFNVYGKDRVLSAIASGQDDLFWIPKDVANATRAMIRANLSDQRGAQVGASPAAQGPIEQSGGRGTVNSSTPANVRLDPKTLFTYYNRHPDFKKDFMFSPSYAQRKYNIPQAEYAAMVNDNGLFFDTSAMQRGRDWVARNVPSLGSTPETRAEDAYQYGLNQPVDPNKPNPVDKKPAYPTGSGTNTGGQSNSTARNSSGSGSKFTVNGSSNSPNNSIASIQKKLPQGSNPMYVASALRSNPGLASKYGLSSSEARMLLEYYGE